MKSNIKFYTKLHPKDCVLIAAWPGIGNVSLMVAQYLKDKLKAEEIGEIVPFVFFDPIGVMVRNNVIETPRFPESKFYYWPNPGANADLIIFMGEEQPGSKSYRLAQCVLEAARKFKVKKVFTFAAAISRIHHTEKPKAWAAATNQKLADELKQYNVILKGDIQIAGLNGIFLGAAKEKNVDGICLLGEVPSYATRIPNPKAALVILEILSKMLHLDLDLKEITELARESEEEMKKMTAQAMGQFIDQFTRPIWEQDEEET